MKHFCKNLTTYRIDLVELAFEERLLEVGDGPHDGVVLGHDGLQPCCRDAQLERVRVADQLLGRLGELDVERLLAQVADLAEQQEELGVKVHVNDLRPHVIVLVILFGNLQRFV